VVGRERLTIGRTPTGYWVVQEGAVDLAGALTRKAAEAERDLRERLRARARASARALRRPTHERAARAPGVSAPASAAPRVGRSRAGARLDPLRDELDDG
jgi:hypothetical protein